MFSGCEVIPEDKQLIPLPNAEPVSNTLLVEFTGFLCVNCPTAAQEAARLQAKYPDNLVVVAMHPEDNHFTQTGREEYDYTCPEANVYYRHFGGSGTTPFPTGIVDMNGVWLDYPSWTTAVLTSIMQEKTGYVNLTVTDVDATHRSFDVSAAVWASDDARLLLWLVADSVHGAQMMPDGSTNLAYTHRHMLRASITDDPWGMAFTFDAESDTIHTRALNYVVTDTVGTQVLPLTDYRIVAVLYDEENETILDVQQKQITD